MGRSLEKLSITERKKFAGKWVAFEIYTPDTTPEKLIQAVGSSPMSCIEQLRERGLDPARYEFIPIKPAF
jgi:hypothetical protein